jgi:hypothetical protein
MLKKYSAYLNSLICLAAMSGCFLFLLNRTWLKWGDLIVDTFREFWIPMRLLEGSVLYRDVFYEYGFLPPYFQALLFKLFGVHLHTLAGLGIVITLLTAAALNLISRLFLDRIVSALTVIVFFLAFAFGHYTSNNNFNFILPYSFASTLFLLFTLYALLFFLRFIKSGHCSHLSVWMFCMTAAMFCRVELPLLVWTGFFITGCFYAVKHADHRSLGLWLRLIAPVAASLAGYCLFVSSLDAWSGFRESVIGPALFLKDDYFQKMVMGMDNPSASLRIIAQSALLTLVLFPLLALCTAGISRVVKSPVSALLCLSAGLAGIALAVACRPELLNGIQYRCLSLFLPAGVFYYAWRYGRTGDAFMLQLFCLFLAALLLGLRMLLNMGPALYGFYLLVVGLICYQVVIFRMIRPAVIHIFPGISRVLLSLVFIGFLLLPAWDYWSWSAAYYERRTAIMVSDKGTFAWFDDDQTQAVFMTITWLHRNTPADATVAVFPEGVGINFFAGRKDPLKYCNFMPPVLQYIGYDKLVEDLAANDVDYVVIIGRGASDYGYPFFGVDYGQGLMNWIKQHYHLEQVIGAMPFNGDRFGAAVYRKNQ